MRKSSWLLTFSLLFLIGGMGSYLYFDSQPAAHYAMAGLETVLIFLGCFTAIALGVIGILIFLWVRYGKKKTGM